ncbi:hypothetical protein CC78DRAFT_54091 [Lojkania enalia]|uniref:Uncharacterized protein n=1 Tax=Lojkania enalia TaxID=147567 RepID=A0A9P4K2L5_9PLEO|nr:hypothetical protein CC78DRAFT_54091 [Didymosphaeria enalia]
MGIPVRFLPVVHNKLVARITKCETTPDGSDSYGRLKYGRLVVDAPVFETFPHNPEGEWNYHDVPVEIRFPENDKRKRSIGSLFGDLPDNKPQFPYYALFLDPENAIILKSRLGVPNDQPGVVLANEGLGPKASVMKALENPERIGVACFNAASRRVEIKNPIFGDQSGGCVSEKDLKMRVTIF